MTRRKTENIEAIQNKYQLQVQELIIKAGEEAMWRRTVKDLKRSKSNVKIGCFN
jgi:hypothetical protein